MIRTTPITLSFLMLSPQLKKTIQQCFKYFRDEIPNFVSRKEQNYMVAEIAKILAGEYERKRLIGVIEAGTGTGKSLAYCLGAIPLALSTGKKLCISTATVALQEQLLAKDLPLFRQYSRLDFQYGVVKGRQRYICASKLELLADSKASNEIALWQHQPDKSDLDLISALWQAWLDKKWDGERDSWPKVIKDSIWQHIASDKFSCNKQLAAHRGCPFHKARDIIDKLDVIIVNHSLLLADLELGGGTILPEPDSMFYVIDEAHHLPEQARNFSSASSSLLATIDWLAKFDIFAKKISGTVKTERLIGPVMQLCDNSNELVSDLKLVKQWLSTNSQLFNNDDKRHRFEHGVLPESLVVLAENCLTSSKSGLKYLNKIHQVVLELYKDGAISPWQIEPLLVDIGSNLNRMENQVKLWQMLSFKQSTKSAPMVRWIELTDPIKNEFFLRASPIEVGYFLEDKLWSQAHGVILCSATLLALDSFDNFKKAAGLKDNDGTQFVKLLSPFDFDKNSKLIIADMPVEPNDPSFVNELVSQIKKRVKGQMASLVLFTSYKQMNQVAKDLREQHNISLLVQGEASRSALLKLHKDKCDNKLPSILFGTSSFSEGLDLPGNYLTNLIITKLPFAVPSSPVEQAHAEYIKSKSGNPFMLLTVPDASRKLIQACGRLLRNEQDQGTITILDRRLVTKRYGKSLINSLPPYKLTIEQ